MKPVKIALICSVAIVSLHCTAQEKERNHLTNKTNKMTAQSVQKVELEEMTRGTNKNLVFTSEAAISTVNGQKSTRKHTAADWDKIRKAAEAIDVSKIDTYEAPTQARFYDGALAATIRIHKNGKVYTSQSFDSGKPPKQLAALYNLLAPGFKSK